MGITARELTANKMSDMSRAIAISTIFIDAGCILKLTEGPIQAIGGMLLLCVLVSARIYFPSVVLRSKQIGAKTAAWLVTTIMIIAYAITATLLASAIADTIDEHAARNRDATDVAVFARQRLTEAQQRLDELLGSAGDVSALAGSAARVSSINSSIERVAAGGMAKLDSLMAETAKNSAGKSSGLSVAAFMGSDCSNTNPKYSGMHLLYAARCNAILAEIATATAGFKTDASNARRDAYTYQQIQGARAALDSARDGVNAAGSSAGATNAGYPAFTQVLAPLFGAAWINADYTPQRAALAFSWIVAIAVAGVVWAFAHGEAVHNTAIARNQSYQSEQSLSITGAIRGRLNGLHERTAMAIAGQSQPIARKTKFGMGIIPHSEPIADDEPRNRETDNRQSQFNMARARGLSAYKACQINGIPVGSASRYERNRIGN